VLIILGKGFTNSKHSLHIANTWRA